MKNKDIFEAIDKIDDEFVNSAGKYLGGFADTDPVEVRPASKKLSTVKIIAPIAAALALVCGVTIAVGMNRQSTYSPAAMGVGTADGEDTSSDIGADETSTPTDTDETSDTESIPYVPSISDDKLPIGPDGKQLTSEDPGSFHDNHIRNDVEQPGTAGLQKLFAYYAEPSGANYNSADNPEAFTDGFTFKGSTEFKRLYDDNHGDENFGNFNVFSASSEFTWASDDFDELVYRGSNLCLYPGYAFLENVYLVKSDDEYYIIARNGETHLPSINIKQLKDEDRYALIPYSGTISGLQYLTETPPILVNINSRALTETLNRLLDENGYIKARVLIENVRYYETDDVEAYISDIASIQLAGGAEPKDVAAVINRGFNIPEWMIETEVSIAELKAELMEKFGFTDVRVYRNFSDSGLQNEFTEGNLVPGNAVTVYDENGLCGIYVYSDYK